MPKAWTTAERAFLVANYSGMTAEQLSSDMGRSVSSVRNAIRRFGLNGTFDQHTKRRKIDFNEVKELINFGFSSNMIAREMGFSGEYVRYVARAHLPKQYRRQMIANGNLRKRTHNNIAKLKNVAFTAPGLV